MMRSARMIAAAMLVAGGAGAAAWTGGAMGQVYVTNYEVLDLGLTAEHSTVCPCFFARAVNAAGEATGFFFGADGTYNAFVYANGAMIDIGPPGENRAFARGMNDLGHVVGWTDVFAPQHGFLWDGESMIDLGTLGGTYSDANDVNNAGQVAGSASTHPPDDDEHAAIWEDGDWTDLGTLGGAFSEALAISEGGAIVGWSWNEQWDSKAVYWNTDLSGPYELPSLAGADPTWFSYANGLNESGFIVGQVQVGVFESFTQWRAVTWTAGQITDLGLLDEAGVGTSLYGQTAHVSTSARAVNEAGVIVGMSFPEAGIPQLRPGPWIHRDSVMTNLNDLLVANEASWIIREVEDINDAGVITGSAQTPDDAHSRAVLLVPVQVLQGDLDVNGQVNIADLLALLSQWGPCTGCPADLDDDRQVSITDLLLLLANWT